MESKLAYRLCFGTQWPFSGLLTIGAIFLPESPVWLLRKKTSDNNAAARKAMNRLYQQNKSHNLEEVFTEIKRTVQMEAAEFSVKKESYVACLQGTNFRRTIIVVFAEFIPLLFGLQLLGSSSYFMQQNGMEPRLSLIVQVSGVACGVVACCITFYTLSRIGRRSLIISSMASITVLWGAVGLCGIRQDSPIAMWQV
jgi:SP family general alpha glucoside:H+ symporter-like MFS transporter